MAVANALAYFDTAAIMAVKCFMVQARLKAFEVVKKRSSLPPSTVIQTKKAIFTQ
jgi:hypothetical protein